MSDKYNSRQDKKRKSNRNEYEEKRQKRVSAPSNDFNGRFIASRLDPRNLDEEESEWFQ